VSVARAQTDTDTGTGTAPTFTLPGAITAGNLLVAVVRYDHATGTITARSGWTKVAEAFSSRRTCLLYRVADGTESGSVTPCDFSASAPWACQGIEYSGVWRAVPLDVEGAQADNDTSKTSPTLDPLDAAERLGVAYAMSNSGTSWSSRKVGGVAATTVVNGSLLTVWERIFTTDAATVDAEVTASVSANGTCGLALFRGMPTQAVQVSAPSAATVGKAAARTLLLGLATSAGQVRGVGKVLAVGIGVLGLSARAANRFLTLAAGLATAASRSLLDLSGTPRCVVAAFARGLVFAARSRRTTVAVAARVLTFVAKEPCP
jgi:hypothetical protein